MYLEQTAGKRIRLVFVLFITTLGTLSGCASPRMHAEAPLASIPDVMRDADLLIGVMQDIHPGYGRYQSASDREKTESEFRLAASNVKNSGQFYLALSRYLAATRCEHTEAELPKSLMDWRDSTATMFPLAFEWITGTAIITGLASGVVNVAPGEELVSVNGRTMSQLFSDIQPMISVDGYTDHTKTALFAGSDDIGLTTFDVYYPLIHGFHDSFDVTVRDETGKTRAVTLAATTEGESRKAHGQINAQQNFNDEGAVSWELAGSSAVLRLNTFVNYRTPVDPDRVLSPVFQQIAEAGVERLVLDLRDVGGGSDDVMISLLRHLIDRPITVGGPARVKTYSFDSYREYLRTWDEGVFDLPAALFEPDGDGMFRVSPQVIGGESTIEPAQDAWKGQLTVLIGPHNESGATMLLAELKDERSVTYIGEPTGGSAEGPTAGVIAYLDLPESGITVRIPLIRSKTSYTSFETGKGIIPDILIAKTVDDVRTGRDRVLEMAISR